MLSPLSKFRQFIYLSNIYAFLHFVLQFEGGDMHTKQQLRTKMDPFDFFGLGTLSPIHQFHEVALKRVTVDHMRWAVDK